MDPGGFTVNPHILWNGGSLWTPSEEPQEVRFEARGFALGLPGGASGRSPPRGASRKLLRGKGKGARSRLQGVEGHKIKHHASPFRRFERLASSLLNQPRPGLPFGERGNHRLPSSG